MIFPYRKIYENRYEPIVPLSLKTKNGWLNVAAFVDTGADYSVFPAATARILGLDMTAGQQIQVTIGDGNRIAIHVHQVSVKFAAYEFRAAIAFSRSYGAGFNLIGRKSFFEIFRFCFDDRNKVITVTKLHT